MTGPVADAQTFDRAVASQAPDAATAPVLFAPLESSHLPAVSAVVREARVGVDVTQLGFLGDQPGGLLTLTFFDDATFLVRFDRLHDRPTEWYGLGETWTGTLPTDHDGWFVLTLQRGVVTADLWTGDGHAYRLRTGPEGSYVAQELDPEQFAPCGGAIEPGWILGPQISGAPLLTSCGVDDGSQIDALIVYTPATLAGAGGQGQIEGMAANAVAAANAAYEHSGIATQLRLVHIAEVDYTEEGNATDLGRLAGTDDGFMDEVHGMRDEYRADVVTLLSADPSGCGKAYLMTSLTGKFADNAFSVVEWYCGTLTLAHEVGHNMGACHADGDGGGCNSGGIFEYSSGYRFTGDSGQTFRTVMAYAPGVRIRYFSNPDVTYDGQSTGTELANNALTLSQTAGTVANFRMSDSPSVWKLRSTTGPSPRTRHAMVYDAARQCVVLFGGTSGGVPVDDTWERNGQSWTQRGVTGPSARYWHAMAYDAARQVVVLFGGEVGGSPSRSRETWEWDGTFWTLRANDGPPRRERHAMAYDAARGVTVLFGGTNGPLLGDTWEWDGNTWTQRATTGPSPRYWPTMAYDVARQKVVLYGGWDGDYKGDTWEWDGTSWTRTSTAIPTARYTSMTYDDARQRLVIFGGWNSPNALGDTWERDDTFWMPRANSGPLARQRQAIAYDSARQQIVVFGGIADNSAEMGDTWELPSWIAVDTEPGDAAVLSGNDADFTVVLSGLGSPEFQWRHDGLALADGPTGSGSTISGSNTDTLTIQNVGVDDAGLYDVQVFDECGWATSSPAMLTVIDCPGDVNADRTVDLTDLAILLADFGCNAASCVGDVNADGETDLTDLSLLLAHYGTACP